jgi:predicted nucleic acid-binding protein
VSRFVLDASIVLTWCFPDEESQKAEAISERIAAGDRVIVPAFWRHEMLNALLVGERRKRITPELTKAFIDDLERLPVDVDLPVSASIVFNATQALCRKHRLTAYDAAYLEIAIREKTPLATVDEDLRRAAVAEGVQVL